LVNAGTVEECEKQLEKVIPAKFKQHAHHWLILHGRYICKARVPDCANCVIYKWCQYKAKTV
jgi:endonuclease-3